MNQRFPSRSISGNAIEITAPTTQEITDVASAFEVMFGVYPVIRIKGYFTPEGSSGPGNLLNGSYRVITVGERFLHVDLGTGVVQPWIDPAKGRNVTVRLLLPESETDG